MNYIIIENEPIARQNMVEMCRQARPAWTLLATFESISDTVEFLAETADTVDLAISDIELVDGNCFEIFRRIEVNFPVIFTTAYESYLLRAFKVNSLDYILKPITLQALRTAFDKYDRLYSASSAKATHEKIDAEVYRQLLETLRQHTSPAYSTRILTGKGDQYGYINVDNIACFLSEDKYVFALTFDGKKLFTTYPSLTDIETDVDPIRFFRISRSYLVNIEAIASVSKYFGGRLSVTLQPLETANSAGDTNPIRITVTSSRRKQFLNWLGTGHRDQDPASGGGA